MAVLGAERDLKMFGQLESEELDDLKSALAQLLLEETDLDPDEVFELVFRRGSRITWH